MHDCVVCMKCKDYHPLLSSQERQAAEKLFPNDEARSEAAGKDHTFEPDEDLMAVTKARTGGDEEMGTEPSTSKTAAAGKGGPTAQQLIAVRAVECYPFQSGLISLLYEPAGRPLT